MQKKITYYIRDNENSKECLSREDLLRDVEKLVDYFANKEQLDSVIVTVEGDVVCGEFIEEPATQEINFASLKDLQEEPLDSDLVNYDPNTFSHKHSSFKEAGL